MPHPLDPMIAEMEYAFDATRRVLEQVPADRLDWRPHPRGMSLGELALHTAGVPSSVARMAAGGDVDVTTVDFTPKAPESRQAILTAFEQSREHAADTLRSIPESRVDADWRFVAGERVLMTMPVRDVVRQVLLNHLYHHRGQLCTYLRAIGVTVPAVFGFSADENPLADAPDPSSQAL